MEINYIKRQDLDVEKYDSCIENAIQSRIYAFSWYLDIVADNWDVLVYKDYEAVMPVPWKRKFFIKYITQPYYCQQLGVFSVYKLSEEIECFFIKNIPKFFFKVNLNFNASNLFRSENNRVNYILNLNRSYEELFKNFSKRRKRSIKTSIKNQLYIDHVSINELIKIKEEYYPNIKFPKHIVAEISDFILKNREGFIHGVFKDETLLVGSLFLKTENRIVYLFSAYNKDLRKLQASSFSINTVIEEYQNLNILLDFEGSNIQSIASFFKSFGPEKENYYTLSYNIFGSKSKK